MHQDTAQPCTEQDSEGDQLDRLSGASDAAHAEHGQHSLEGSMEHHGGRMAPVLLHQSTCSGLILPVLLKPPLSRAPTFRSDHPIDLVTTMERTGHAPPAVRALLPLLLQSPLVALTLVADAAAPPPRGWRRPASADVWYTEEQEAAMMAHDGTRLFASALPGGDAAALPDGAVVVHMVQMLRVLVDGAPPADDTAVLSARDGCLEPLDGVHFMVGTSEYRSVTGVPLPSATVSMPWACGARRHLTVAVPNIVGAWLGGVSAAQPKRERAAYVVTEDLYVDALRDERQSSFVGG
eukprot:TRINITY_DN8187_c0_g2_i3.p1 TRINITY_DN8187_c0_g2~~TRINITY_DN8187_c0_g2_i3.p1  ORF type:complete len:294 (-),score=92.61 TRINITY_DN8187_c0_g2_i3:113-994(-)